VDKIKEQKIKEAKELLEKYAPKGEFLAYINKKEAQILKAYGGTGNPVKETNIPSFIPAWVLPAVIGLSTAVSFIGSLSQARNLRQARKNEKIAAQELALARKIQIKEEGAAKLSRLRALSAFSNTQIGEGSNRFNSIKFVKSVESAIHAADQGFFRELSNVDDRATSLLAQNYDKRGQSLLSGAGGIIASGYETGLFG
tara:strand:+ start:786 stop:1382 length:597 start_codon:yes stop_codon:yes gene_type:complete